MIDWKKEVWVKNRSDGTLSYKIPEIGVNREFGIGESKPVTADELRRLSFTPGGAVIIEHFLLINDEEVRSELMGDTAPEYFYTDEEVDILLTDKGTIEQLEDALNFAPDGVIDLIKDRAFKLPCKDVDKRELIKEKTGFDVTKALEIDKISREAEEPKEPERKAEVVKKTSSKAAGRKAEPIKKKYEVVK